MSFVQRSHVRGNISCSQDMEALLHAQAAAEKDPLGFVDSLKNGVSLVLYDVMILCSIDVCDL